MNLTPVVGISRPAGNPPRKLGPGGEAGPLGVRGPASP
jgi:hypothetical protein